jgi:O-antigen/teichoic acid export membrane protein
MLFFVLVTYLRHLLHGQLLINEINISNILERVLYILLLLLFVWYLNWGLEGVSLALSISSLLLLFQLIRHAYKYKPEFLSASKPVAQKGLIKKLWNYGQWSYYAGFTTYTLEQFPIIYLKSTIGAFAQIGFFTKAQGLANYPKIMAVPASGLLFSYNAGSDSKRSNTRTDTICRISFWLVTILFVTLSIFIKPVIVLLYGKDFLPAADIFVFLYPSIVFYIQSLYLSSDIAARGFNKQSFTIRLKSLPVIIVAAYFLITYLGLKGAAIAVSFSFTLIWVQYVLKYKEISGSGFSNTLLLRRSDFVLFKTMLDRLFVKFRKSKNEANNKEDKSR